MAKKNITFRIDEKLIEKMNEIRGKTSQNAFLELLITSWGNKTTSTSTSTSTNNPSSEVTLQLQLLVQAQQQLQAMINGGTIVIDEAPPLAPLSPETFYGEVKPYVKGPYDNDPLKYLDYEDEPKQKKVKEEWEIDEKPW